MTGPIEVTPDPWCDGCGADYLMGESHFGDCGTAPELLDRDHRCFDCNAPVDAESRGRHTAPCGWWDDREHLRPDDAPPAGYYLTGRGTPIGRAL